MGNSLLLVLFLFFLFHFDAQLTSSSSSTADPNSPFLCRPLQSHALLQFKSTFIIDSEASLFCDLFANPSNPRTESWKEGTDCCSSWDGVTCSEETGHVIELDLSCSQLEGIIHSNNTLFSPHIAPYLQRLNLAYNDFQGSNMCSQFGVKFGSSLTSLMNLSSSLTSLSLRYCLLQGQFPVSFLLRRNIQVLDLSSNNFDPVTSLPDFDSTTPSHNLTDLYLSYTDLSSVSIHFLDFVGNLKCLITLYLRNCSLSGSFGNLPKLTRLDLSANKFSGPIPASICSMTQLLYLDLGDNHLCGMLPSCLFAMPSLQTFRLNDNKLHSQIPTSPLKSVNLTHLDLSSNSGSFDLHMLLDLKKLTTLHLSHIDLSSSTSTSYSLPSLRSLYLSSCNLTELPSFSKELSNLIELDISNNKIQGYLPIPPVTIEFFSVSNNSLTGEISSLICNLTSLEILDLSHNLFVGLIPPCLGNLSRVYVLNLGKNNLHGTIPNTFAKNNNLNHLNFNENQLSGRLPHSLSYCQNLGVLDVGNNMLEDVFPHWLEILSPLQVLVLRSNKFFGSINGFKSHFSFPNLIILDVSNNNLVGQLPTTLFSNLQAMRNVHKELGDGERYMQASITSYYYSVVITVKGFEREYVKILKTLTIVDLSSNKFEGDIPEVIGKLGALKGLNLSHNLLTGHIPPSMGDLANLEWLYLSSNKLVGRIPRVLADLTFLAVLNLSHNQLDGPIPRGKQFNTFGNESYEENSGLCGLPLSKACERKHERRTLLIYVYAPN